MPCFHNVWLACIALKTKAQAPIAIILLAAWPTTAVFSQSDIIISEILASNDAALLDQDGDSSDWLEIYNSGTDPMNLEGWFLSDRADNLTKWSFPSVLVNPDSYLIVYASGKDRGEPGQELHTNFKLSADGEYLGLVHPDGVTVADAYSPEFPPQYTDVSYGRMNPEDPPEFMSQPTPGEVNQSGFLEFTPNPVADPEGGFYEQATTVTLTADNPGDTLYYTLDNSDPGPDNGTIYNGPIQIDATVALRFLAIREDLEPSEIVTHTYIFLDDVIRQSANGSTPTGFPASRSINNKNMVYGMDPDIVDNEEYSPLIKDALIDIPSLSIVTDPDNLFDQSNGIYVNPQGEGRDWERPGSLELLNPDGTPGFQVNAGLRIRGGATRTPNNPKNAFRFIFRNEYGAGKLRYPFFGDEGVDVFDKIDIRTAQGFAWQANPDRASENTFLRDVLSRDSEGAMGNMYTRSRYYHLYLNGQYWGLYQTEERIDPDWAASYLGGDPLDYDSVKVDRGFFWQNNRWVGKVPFHIYAAEGEMDTWHQVWELAQKSNRGSEQLDDNENYFHLLGRDAEGNRDPEKRVLVNADNLINYMVLKLYSSDHDGPISFWMDFSMPNNSYSLYNRNSDEGFFFVTHDNEFAYHVTGVPEYDNRNGDWTAGNTFETSNPHWLHNRMVSNLEYRIAFADAAYRALYNDGALTVENNLARMHERRDQIDLAMIAESARWGDTVRSQPYTHADWETAVGRLEDFLVNRGDMLLAQFREVDLFPTSEPLELSVMESSVEGDPVVVSIENPNSGGEIYFTFDGSDPREVGGAINPYAILYTNPVAVPELATHARARFWNDGEWGVLIDVPIPGSSAPEDNEKRLDFWRNLHFNEADLLDPEKDNTVWGNLADPDRDKLSNRVEYYMGLDPNNGNLGKVWLLPVEPGDSDFVTFTYRWSATVNVNLCKPEWSKDLSGSPINWSSENVVINQIANLDNQVMIEVTIPVTPGDKAIFVRLNCE